MSKAPRTRAEPKNHGQARSQEVHERKEARKAAKNDDKAEGMWDKAKGTTGRAWHDVKDATRDAWNRIRT